MLLRWPPFGHRRLVQPETGGKRVTATLLVISAVVLYLCRSYQQPLTVPCTTGVHISLWSIFSAVAPQGLSSPSSVWPVDLLHLYAHVHSYG